MYGQETVKSDTVETALPSFLVAVPPAAVIWATALLVGAIAAAAIILPRLAAGRAAAQADPGDETGPEAAAALRYADEVAALADRAAITVHHRRDEWRQAQHEVDAAWAAYDEADRGARRIAAATAFPMLSRRRKLGDNADRERYLHQAATAACRNHELSIAQLNDVLAHRGWNARLHPVAQEAVLRNAIREHRYEVYREASLRERETWEIADTAAVALRCLRVEACAATLRPRAPAPADDLEPMEDWTVEEPVAASVS
jgi:hypothetical protein